jgi:NADH-quinone oxidoreductase subunit D
MGWHMTMEKLLKVETPKKVDYMRVIIMELARIADHLVCNTVLGVDAGALTGFTYMFQERERIYDMYEEIAGARLTSNIGRVGGFERDFTPGFHAKLKDFLSTFPKRFEEFDALITRNRIFMDRVINVGSISAEDAISYSFAGPNLRAAGVDYDVRVHTPYSSYQDFEFIVPVGTTGDSYDRFLVRNEEMWQSLSIINQAYQKIQHIKGADAEVYHANVPEYYLPPKQEVYTSMEALIWHFKIIMGEIDMPKGEVYHSVEGANGELGFYLISDGGRTPYRLHFRRPCFIYYQAYPELIKGAMLSDAIVVMSSLNLIAGELDA